MKPHYSSPYEFLDEISAYLGFRCMTDHPTVPAEDMQQIKRDIDTYLDKEGYTDAKAHNMGTTRDHLSSAGRTSGVSSSGAVETITSRPL